MMRDFSQEALTKAARDYDVLREIARHLYDQGLVLTELLVPPNELEDVLKGRERFQTQPPFTKVNGPFGLIRIGSNHPTRAGYSMILDARKTWVPSVEDCNRPGAEL